MSRIAVKITVAGMVAVIGASASTISDFSQVAGSDFGMYGLIVAGGGHNTQLTSDTFVTANVALGSPISLQGSNTTITGNLDVQGSLNNNDGTTVTGTTTTNTGSSGSAALAITDAGNLFTAYTALTGLPAITGSTLNVNSTPGSSFNGNSNENVYAASTSWNGALTITADANEYVIIVVGNGSNSNWSLGAINLAGGIASTQDHVLIVVDSKGTLSSSNAHGLVVNADVIDDPSGKVNVDNFTLNGRLFCSTGSNDCQVVSNAKINASVDAALSTPEPISFVLTGSGLLLALAFRRFPVTIPATIFGR